MSTIFDNEHYGIIADKVCLGIVLFTTLIVSLRIYCRLSTGSERYGLFGPDDALTLFCLAIIWATQILISIAASHGLGQHFDDIPPDELVEAMKYNTTINSVIQWAFSTPKFAIIVLLRRILNYGTRTAILFWTVAIIGQIFVLAISTWNFEQCDPIEKNWVRDMPGRCANPDILSNLGLFGSAYSAFLDLFFALYPIPMVMRLQLPLRTRIVVCVTLGLGVFACAVQVYKMSIIGRAWDILAHDPTFPTPYLNTMGLSEACILVIAGSLPTLGPLFRCLKRKYTQYAAEKYPSPSTRQAGSNATYVHRDTWPSAHHGKRGWARIYDPNRFDWRQGRDSLAIGNRTLVTSSKDRDVESSEGAEMKVLVTTDVTIDRDDSPSATAKAR